MILGNKSSIDFIKVVGFFTSLTVLIFYSRKLLFFRDYSIIWDGATRIISGQSMYKDFGIPFGPVSLYLPILFLKCFKTSWTTFQCTQLFINAALIANIFILLKNLNEKLCCVFSALSVFFISYILLQTHPWYNTTAFLLALVSLNLSLGKPFYYKFLSGLAAGLCIFAKQDFGILIFLIAFFMMFFDTYKFKFSYRKLTTHLICFLIGFSIILVFFIALYKFKNLSYWFNLGQYPHQHRRPSVLQLFNTITLLGFLATMLGLAYRLRNFVVYGLLILMSSVTTFTSGLFFSHYYAFFCIPIITFHSFKKKRLRFFRLLLLPISLFVLLPVLANPYYIFENILTKEPEHYYFKKGILHSTLTLSITRHAQRL